MSPPEGDAPAPAVVPRLRDDDGPVFAEPWHAQVLAVADALVSAGVISAPNWAEALGAALREAEAGGAPDDEETYYAAALAALERLASARGAVDAGSLADRVEAWRAAYLRTPHGQPVVLGD